MKDQFNEESLQKLGIFELRNLAREIGVYSPTIYKKKEIIDKILAIVNGEAQPHVAKTKQGRPPKSINGLNNLLDIFIPKDVIGDVDESFFNSDHSFTNMSNLTAMENLSGLNYNVNEDEIIVQGILKVFNEGYGFCYTKGCKTDNQSFNYFVSYNYVKKYNLKTGDVLKGKGKIVSNDKPRIMYKLEFINNVAADEFDANRKNFEDSLAMHPNEKIIRYHKSPMNSEYLNKFVPIGKGQRSLMIVAQNFDYSAIISDFLNSIKKGDKSFESVCILVDERPEDITEYTLKLKCDKVIATTFEDNPIQAVQKIELTIERAKRLVEVGKDVVIVISNLNRLQNLYKKLNAIKAANSTDEGDIRSSMMVKRLLTSARNTKDMGSLTILSIVEDRSKPEFISGLEDLCNMQVYVIRSNYPKVDKLWFNLLKSKTRKMELLLTEEEVEFVKKCRENLNEDNLDEMTRYLERSYFEKN